MEVRNTLLAAVAIQVLAVAALLAPGAGVLTSIAAGIATSMVVALVLLAALSWRLGAGARAATEEAVSAAPGAAPATDVAEHPAATERPAARVSASSPAALAG